MSALATEPNSSTSGTDPDGTARAITIAVGGQIVSLDPEQKDAQGFHADGSLLRSVQGFVTAGVDALRNLAPHALQSDLAARVAAIEVGNVLRCIVDADGYPCLNWLKAPEPARLVIAGMFTEVFPVREIVKTAADREAQAAEYAAYQGARKKVTNEWQTYIRDGIAWKWAKEIVAPELTADEAKDRAIVVGPQGTLERVYSAGLTPRHTEWMIALYKRNNLIPPTFLVPRVPKGTGTGVVKPVETPATAIDAVILSLTAGQYTEEDALTGALRIIVTALRREMDGKRSPNMVVDKAQGKAEAIALAGRILGKMYQGETLTGPETTNLGKLTGRKTTAPTEPKVPAAK